MGKPARLAREGGSPPSAGLHKCPIWLGCGGADCSSQEQLPPLSITYHFPVSSKQMSEHNPHRQRDPLNHDAHPPLLFDMCLYLRHVELHLQIF